MPSFAELGVSDEVVAALTAGGFSEAFPIQAATITAALDGRDICGKAPTGSGKTLAFGIPAVDLANMGTPWCPSVLILSPTRELATQIKDEIAPIAKAKDRTVLTVFGGTNIERDIKRLEKGVDILVACPGRLEDLISRRCCELRNVELVVVDEADRMADMGFLPSVKRLLDQTPSNRHTLLFSATLDGDVDMLIKRYQNDPLTFEVEEQVGEIGDVEHSWYLVQPVDRISSAVEVLKRYESSIVFCRTRRGCDRVANMLAKRGLSAVAIHGDRSQGQRERALREFTNGRAQVLVATDVAARGIHVDNVALVMHYDPAGSDKDYIHRSGRTGRAGQDGRVISMVVEDKKKIARQLQKDLGIKPGLDDLDLEALGPIVEPRTPVDPEPIADRGNRQRKGSGDKNRGGKNRAGDNRRGDKNRGGNNRDGDKNRGGKNRDGDKNRGGKNRDGRKSRGPRDRDDRDRNDRRRDDRRGGRSFDRDDGDGRNSRDGRDDRRSGGKRRPRRGSNDWYPPGYHDDRDRDDDRSRGGKGKPGKKRGSGGRSSDRDDRERSQRPAGGRNTTKRKNRSAKGRHADKTSTKNKGKRRNPRSK